MIPRSNSSFTPFIPTVGVASEQFNAAGLQNRNEEFSRNLIPSELNTANMESDPNQRESNPHTITRLSKHNCGVQMSWNNKYPMPQDHRSYANKRSYRHMNDISNLRQSSFNNNDQPQHDEKSGEEASSSKFQHVNSHGLPNQGGPIHSSRNTYNTSINNSSIDNNDSNKTRRKPRTVFSRYQLTRMKEAFGTKPYLTTEERRCLAAELNVTCEQIKVWFQNHRSKLKRQGKLLSNQNNDQIVMPMSMQQQCMQYHAYGVQPGTYIPNYSMGQHPMNHSMPTNPYFRQVGYTADQQPEYMNPPIYPSNDCYVNNMALYQSPNTGNSAISEQNMAHYQYQQSSRGANPYLSQVVLTNGQPAISQPQGIQRSINYPGDVNFYKSGQDLNTNKG